MKKMFIFTIHNASRQEFVDFWSRLYHYKNNNLDDQYEKNIDMELTRKKLEILFEWKNGNKLSEKKRSSIEKNFIDRIDELKMSNKDVDPENMLENFKQGGPIWRIFFFHCWKPKIFPIYDQHVHRAMEFIQSGTVNEISTKDAEIIGSYLRDYIPFHKNFDGLDKRKVDKALWAFGKFLKEYKNLPATVTDE